jgi:hypothetical protein
MGNRRRKSFLVILIGLIALAVGAYYYLEKTGQNGSSQKYRIEQAKADVLNPIEALRYE